MYIFQLSDKNAIFSIKNTIQKKKFPTDVGNFSVPEAGLEPARRKPYAPETYVSTNFTTRAGLVLSNVKLEKLLPFSCLRVQR